MFRLQETPFLFTVAPLVLAMQRSSFIRPAVENGASYHSPRRERGRPLDPSLALRAWVTLARERYTRAILAAGVLAIVLLPCSIQAANTASKASTTTALDPDQIRAMLRTTTVEDAGFIDRVVAWVDRGKLPSDLVETTLLWARKKERHKFQYFKFALTARAADLGIDLNKQPSPLDDKHHKWPWPFDHHHDKDDHRHDRGDQPSSTPA